MKIKIQNASTKIGDIFSIAIDENKKKYFQYVTNDHTQLNSDVIRVFKTFYSTIVDPDLNTIINDQVDFYAHCVTKWGIKLGYWTKYGNVAEVGKVDTLFRTSGDHGNLSIVISENWWVWKVNEPRKYVGKLEGENRNAEIGSVIPPDSIVHRMRTGKYDFVYPQYK